MKLDRLAMLSFTKLMFLIFFVVIIGNSFSFAKTNSIKRVQITGKESYPGQFLAANLALASRDYKNANQFLLNLYRLRPDDDIVVESLFVSHLITGKFSQASIFAKRYHQLEVEDNLQQSAHHYLSKIMLALDNLKQGHAKLALDHVEKGDDFMISEMNFHLLSAWINFANDKPLATKQHIDLLKENSYFTIYHLINSAILAELQDRQKDADNFYNEALSLGGTKIDLIEAYGRFLERTGRKKQAFALYDDFENRAGRSDLITQARNRLITGEIPAPFVANAEQAIAYGLYHIAKIYYDAGNYDESINYARLGQHLAPNNKYLLNIMAQNYQNIGKYLEANEELQKISTGSAFFKQAQIRIAMNQEINGEIDLALVKLGKLVIENDENEILLAAYADMLKRDEQYKKSITYYDKIIGNRKELSINDADLFFQRAVALERLKQWPKAEIGFKKAIELDPSHSSALNYLGYSWVDRGENLNQGLEMIKDALLIEPQNAFIIDSLGWAYYKLGKYDLAKVELERALMVSPGSADINDHLGDVYWKLGRKLEAGFKWQHATIFKSPEINYDDLEYKRVNGLDALQEIKAKRIKNDNG